MVSENQQPAATDGRDEKGRFIPGRVPDGSSPWQPGQSGNPSGRPKGVTYPGDWLRSLIDLDEAELRAVAGDKSLPASKRTAAMSVIRAITRPDLADFEAYLDGGETLRSLKAKGVDTSTVKRVVKRVAKDGGVQTTVELHDWVNEIDRLMDRTEGKATQKSEVEVTRKDSVDQVRARLLDKYRQGENQS